MFRGGGHPAHRHGRADPRERVHPVVPHARRGGQHQDDHVPERRHEGHDIYIYIYIYVYIYIYLIITIIVVQ